MTEALRIYNSPQQIRRRFLINLFKELDCLNIWNSTASSQSMVAAIKSAINGSPPPQVIFPTEVRLRDSDRLLRFLLRGITSDEFDWPNCACICLNLASKYIGTRGEQIFNEICDSLTSVEKAIYNLENK